MRIEDVDRVLVGQRRLSASFFQFFAGGWIRLLHRQDVVVKEAQVEEYEVVIEVDAGLEELEVLLRYLD